MNREKSYYRHHRRRVIERKKRIIKKQNDYWHYKHEGVLSKGKIHCSCRLCRRKSYDEPRMSDIRQKQRLDDHVKEWGEDNAD